LAVGRWQSAGGWWTVDGGRWPVDGGRWTVDGGWWAVAGGRSVGVAAPSLKKFFFAPFALAFSSSIVKRSRFVN